MKSGNVKSNSNQVAYIQEVQRDISFEHSVVLNGDGSQYFPIPPTAQGFLVYQIADASSTLSGSLTVNLEMSNDGINWLQATDAAGEDITHSLSAGSSVMEKLSDVNHFVKLRFNFSSAVTGTLDLSIRV